ncbi:hypothetical protein RSK60_1590027 [Ralstonia solanacearum K60]|nr:hypothetical protein RSK60_1590027 [Ralstonia solanacearum K60]
MGIDTVARAHVFEHGIGGRSYFPCKKWRLQHETTYESMAYEAIAFTKAVNSQNQAVSRFSGGYRQTSHNSNDYPERGYS